MEKHVRELERNESVQSTLQIAELKAQFAKRNAMLFGESTDERPKTKPAPNDEPETRTGHGPREQPNLRNIDAVRGLDPAVRLEPQSDRPT